MCPANSDNFVLLVVTGAYHPPICYESLKKELTALGYECVIPQMPSMGYNTNGITWEADKEKIVETATTYFNQGKEVVLVAHSYGGVPAAAATEGQGLKERADRGLSGGFRSIIFVAAFAVPVKGWDLLTTCGGTWQIWQDTGKPYTKNQLSTVNENGLKLLYNDCSNEEARKTFTQLMPHSQDAFETSINFVASDVTIPKTYVICENDLVFPSPLQEELATFTPSMRKARILAGHSPFVGKSSELAKMLVALAKDQAL